MKTLVLVSLMLSSTAYADIVGPDPEECPDGSTPAACHGGPHCRLDRCRDALPECDTGFECRSINICIGSIDCGSHGESFPTETFETCSTDNCSLCDSVPLCVPASTSTPNDSASGGCASGDATSLALALTLLALARYTRAARFSR